MVPPVRSVAAKRHRLNRVVNFAQAHLDERITLDVLAEIACMSKFHFARVFTGYYREPPLSFLWRLRLERAARKLAFVPGDAITDIAMECGFSSTQAFSQSFRRRFHDCPRRFRRANFWRLTEAAPNAPVLGRPGIIVPSEETAVMPVRIEWRPAYRIAYIRHIGPYDDVGGGITGTFAALSAWARGRGLLDSGTAGFGICPDSATITPVDRCIYDAGISVPEEFVEDDIVSTQTIPAGTYAVLRAKHKRQILGLWEWMVTKWLPTSGMNYDLTFSYEYLPPADDLFAAPLGTDLCLRLCSGHHGFESENSNLT